MAALSSLTSALPPAEGVSATTEFAAPELPLGAPELPSASRDLERSRSTPARLFAASLDTFEVLSVGSRKVEVRCIRTSMDSNDVESAPFTRAPRLFRRALDDAELAAPPDPPRYLRLTLDD